MLMYLFGQPERKQFCKYLKITNPFLKEGQMRKVTANRRKKKKSDTILYITELVGIIKILRLAQFLLI